MSNVEASERRVLNVVTKIQEARRAAPAYPRGITHARNICTFFMYLILNVNRKLCC